MTCRNIAISCLVASIIWFIVDSAVLSMARSIILAANSRPVSFSMHRRTVELIPLSGVNVNQMGLEKKLNVLTCRLIRSKLIKIGTSDTIMHWCPQMHCNVPGNNWLKWRERQTEDDNLEQAHIAVHRQIDHNSRNIQLN